MNKPTVRKEFVASWDDWSGAVCITLADYERDLAAARAERDGAINIARCATLAQEGAERDMQAQKAAALALLAELEAARKDHLRMRNAAQLAQIELLALMVDRVISRSAAIDSIDAAMRQEKAGD